MSKGKKNQALKYGNDFVYLMKVSWLENIKSSPTYFPIKLLEYREYFKMCIIIQNQIKSKKNN